MFESEFAKIPVHAPRSYELLPGLRLRGAVPKWALVLPLIFAGFFMLVPLSIVMSDPATRLALWPRESVQGRVLAAGNGTACRGFESHRVTYAFASKSGSEYRGAAILCQNSPYFSVAAGEPISVEYLASNPSVNAVAGDNRNAPPFAVFLFMPIFFVGFYVSIFWPALRDVLAARRLFKNGRLAIGTVVFVKRRTTMAWRGMPGGSTQVFIQFKTPDGQMAEASNLCQNDWLVNLLAPGTPVHIAYAESDPTRVALLDAFVR